MNPKSKQKKPRPAAKPAAAKPAPDLITDAIRQASLMIESDTLEGVRKQLAEARAGLTVRDVICVTVFLEQQENELETVGEFKVRLFGDETERLYVHLLDAASKFMLSEYTAAGCRRKAVTA